MNFLLKIVLKSVKSAKSASKKELRSTFVENPLQIHLFLQNKPNFMRFSAKKRRFAQKRTQNEPNSKPIGQMPKMNVCPLLTVYYEIL